MTPHRVQRSRAKGWRMPENTVCVDRSTQWGNPYKVGDKILYSEKAGQKPEPIIITQQMAIDLFRLDVLHGSPMLRFHRADLWKLRGKNLACYCAPGQPCHADVLLEMANAETLQAERGNFTSGEGAP